jgi:hypothetical protein
MNDLARLVHDALTGADRWRRRLFDDEADGQTVNGVKLVRGPDGRLFGILASPKKERTR